MFVTGDVRNIRVVMFVTEFLEGDVRDRLKKSDSTPLIGPLRTVLRAIMFVFVINITVHTFIHE